MLPDRLPKGGLRFSAYNSPASAASTPNSRDASGAKGVATQCAESPRAIGRLTRRAVGDVLASIHAARVLAVAARWLRASVGPTVRLIAVDDIDFLRSDEKYTPIAWRGDGGAPTEAEVRTSLKELVAQLDPNQFAQAHRSVAVNLRSVSHVTRAEDETADIHLKGQREVLPASRSYLPLFKQM